MGVDIEKAGEKAAFPEQQAPVRRNDHLRQQSGDDFRAMRHEDNIGADLVEKARRRLCDAPQTLAPDGFRQQQVRRDRLGCEEVS
ncbi:hypothetical protein D3C87_1866300 [compost metagenome]